MGGGLGRARGSNLLPQAGEVRPGQLSLSGAGSHCVTATMPTFTEGARHGQPLVPTLFTKV